MAMVPLTAAEFEQWLRPSEVLQRLPSDWPDDTKKRVIKRRLADGHIRSAARHSVFENYGSIGSGDFLPIEPFLWAFPWRAVEVDFWTGGDIEFIFDSEPHFDSGFGGPILITEDTPPPPPPPSPSAQDYIGGEYLDVRLHPRDVDNQWPKPPNISSGKAGRPSAQWWEDMWIEIARQLYAGDLDHHSQAALEKAMHDWIAANGHDAGESTVRRRAQRLFQALNREGP